MPPTNFYTEHWNLLLGSIFTFVCCLVGCPKYYGNYSSKRQSPSFWKDYYPIFIWRPKVMKNLPFPLVGNFPTVIGCNSPHHRSAEGLSWIYLTLQQRFFYHQSSRDSPQTTQDASDKCSWAKLIHRLFLLSIHWLQDQCTKIASCCVGPAPTAWAGRGWSTRSWLRDPGFV